MSINTLHAAEVGDGTVIIRSPLGIIAGNGSFPLEIARNAASRGIQTRAALHIGESDTRLPGEVGKSIWLRVGQLGAIIKFFKKEGVTDVVFAGGIRRIKLFGGVKLDLRGLSLIARLASKKDDAVLRGVASEIEREGMRVVAPHLLLQKSLAQQGVLSRRDLTPSEIADAKVGFAVARTSGDLDIGQTVVSFDGVVVAVEAVEGTDRTLERAGDLTSKRGGVVVKLCKRHQDIRLDLPTVGLGTIETMAKAGLTALVLEAGKTIILDPLETIAAANEAGIAVVAYE